MSSYTESEYGNDSIDVDEEIERMNLKYSNLDQISGRAAGLGGNRRQDKEVSEEEDLMMFLKKLRRENEGLKGNLQDLTSSRKTEGGAMQLKKLENDVHRQRQQFDSLRHEIRTLERRIHKKEEELNLLRRTHLKSRVKNRRKKKSGAKGIEDNQKQIRVLENRLDKTIIKLNESQMIRETYVKILKRLKRERMGFDNQLRSIEKTLKSKSNDYEELRQTYHEANYLKELSKIHLKEARASLIQLRKMKQKELEEKKKDVMSRIKNTESMNRRGQKRKELELENQGYISKENREKLQKASVLQQFGDMQSDQSLKKQQDTLNHLETIWRKIKEVTGVGTTKDVIEKFWSSKDTFKNLQKVTRHSQNKIDLLQRKRNNYKEKLESLKFTQSTMTGMGTKRMVDEFIQQLNDSKVLLEKNRKDYERMQNILIRVKSGLSHLLEKLNQLFGGDDKKKKEEDGGDDDDGDEDFPMTDKDFILELIDKSKSILESKFMDIIESEKQKDQQQQKKKIKPTSEEKVESEVEGEGEEGEEGEDTTTTTTAEQPKEDSEVFKEEDEELYQVTKYNTRLHNIDKIIAKNEMLDNAEMMMEEEEDGNLMDDLTDLGSMNAEKKKKMMMMMMMNDDDDDDELSGDDDSDEAELNADDEVDVLNREQVKKLATLALLKHKSKIAKRT